MLKKNNDITINIILYISTKTDGMIRIVTIIIIPIKLLMDDYVVL